jgi:hypothetical protein
MQPIASLNIAGQTVNLFGCHFNFGHSPGFVLVTETGAPYGMVSANVPGYKLADDEMLAKTWDENAAARQPLLESGVFKDTGKRVPYGFVEAEVWKIVMPTKH